MSATPLALFFAVGAIAPHAPASLLEQVTVYGFEIRQSRGSKLRQHVTADMSRVAPDDNQSIIADNPICRVVVDGAEKPATVTSTNLRYYYRGVDRSPELEGQEPPLPLEILREWNTGLVSGGGLPAISGSSKGDILFSDTSESGRVHVDLGDRGQIYARHLLWSEQYQRFIAMGGFEQRTINERGDNIRTTGEVFTADEEFQSMNYPIVGTQVVEIEIY